MVVSGCAFRTRLSMAFKDNLSYNIDAIVKATWRNGSAFGFDRLTVPKGCRFESCGGHFFPPLTIIQSIEPFLLPITTVLPCNLFFLYGRLNYESTFTCSALRHVITCRGSRSAHRFTIAMPQVTACSSPAIRSPTGWAREPRPIPRAMLPGCSCSTDCRCC